LLPGTVAVTIFKVLAGDLNGRGHPQATFRPAATALAASFIGGIIIVPRFGILGAALVTSAGYVLNALLYAHTYSRITAVPIRELLLLRLSDLLIIQGFWTRFRGGRVTHS
jgi:O-antigen/teichoic acid export membrane protein